MIQIDDAGSGSLIGGTCIAALRTDTNEYYSEIIPVFLFNRENFKYKFYIYYTTEIIKNALKKLKVDKNEAISICQGYIFEDARQYLKENNYNYSSTKIVDPLQSIIEKNFENYAVSLGLPREFILYTKYPFHFHRLLKWVYADFENRVNICKTGWKSWDKYSSLETNIYYDKILRSNYVCLKCGKRIENGSSVKVIKYKTTSINYIYTHKNC